MSRTVGAALNIFDIGQPLRAVAVLDVREQFLQHFPRVADDWHVDVDVLVDLGRVELDVDLLCVLRVGLEVARHAVIEAHADGDDQIGLLNCLVDPGLAVHAHHAEVERVGRWETAEAQEGAGHRNVCLFDEVHQRLGRLRLDHAVPREDDRALGRLDEVDRVLELLSQWRIIGAVAGEHDVVVAPLEHAALLLRVLGDVDDDRPGTARAGDVERLANRRCDLLWLGHQVVVLGDRNRAAGDVGFLERIAADELRRDLPGDANHRNRVEHRRGDAGDQVGRARARSRDADADLARSARVAVGHVRGALLVAREHVVDRVLDHRVVGRHDRAARIAEADLDPLAYERFPDDAGSGKRFADAILELGIGGCHEGLLTCWLAPTS